MPYNYLPHYSKKLVENPEISDHNKEVLDKFVQKMEGRGTKPGTINGYLSRFNTLAPKIDFKLDEATQDDLEILASDINQDRVERQRGDGNFADKTKKKFFKALKCFYNQFIRKPGEGFNKDLDGERLVGDISAQTKEEEDDDEDKVNLKKIPTPEQVRKVAAGSSLRDKCIILFCWGIGARTGEVYKNIQFFRTVDESPADFSDKQWKKKLKKLFQHEGVKVPEEGLEQKQKVSVTCKQLEGEQFQGNVKIPEEYTGESPAYSVEDIY